MKIEHVAYQVDEPVAMAEWYVEQIGFSIKYSADQPVPVRFLADDSGQVMIEIYNNPKVETPDYAGMDPLLLHLAFICEDVPGTVKKLIEAGAELISGPDRLKNGDELAMLRDPWGLAIQLCRRGQPMV